MLAACIMCTPKMHTMDDWQIWPRYYLQRASAEVTYADDNDDSDDGDAPTN